MPRLIQIASNVLLLFGVLLLALGLVRVQFAALGLMLIVIGAVLRVIPAFSTHPHRAIPLLVIGLGLLAMLFPVGVLLLDPSATTVVFNLGHVFLIGLVYTLVGMLLFLFVPVIEPTHTVVAAPPASDNFTAIKGIDTAIQRTLRRAGIYTYAQLAEARPQALYRTVSQAHDVFVGDVIVWVRQAQYLVRGETGELAQYQTRLAVGREVEVDDLTLIEGIGRGTNEALKQEGITTFAQLAAMEAKTLEQIIKVKHAVRVKGDVKTWIAQAEYLARGDWQGLEAYQTTLVDGKAG